MAKKIHHLSFSTKHVCAEITEHLRYAGIVAVTGAGSGYLPRDVQNELNAPEGSITISIQCPRGLEPKTWSTMNIARLKSFGVKAVCWTKEN
jgi:hypothetical protein